MAAATPDSTATEREYPVDEWRTGDTALAAFLITKEHECIKMEWEVDSCYFTFAENDDMLDLVVEFMGDEALVNPRTYNLALSNLRKQMFRVRDEAKAARIRTAS